MTASCTHDVAWRDDRRAGPLAVLALILAQGYFVAAEFSFVAARRTRLQELAEEGNRRARASAGVHG